MIPVLARRTRPKGRPSAARDDRVSCIQALFSLKAAREYLSYNHNLSSRGPLVGLAIAYVFISRVRALKIICIPTDYLLHVAYPFAHAKRLYTRYPIVALGLRLSYGCQILNFSRQIYEFGRRYRAITYREYVDIALTGRRWSQPPECFPPLVNTSSTALNPENPITPWMGKFFVSLHIFFSPVHKMVLLTSANT